MAFGSFGEWSPTTMSGTGGFGGFGHWAPTTMSGWAPTTMSGANYGMASYSPFPVRHPGWFAYSRQRKISVLTGEIQRLQGLKQTNARKSRITTLQTLKNRLAAKQETRDARRAGPDMDAEIAALEADLSADPMLDQDPMLAPPPTPSGPSPFLILGGLAVVGAGAYFLLRKKK